MFLVKEFDTQQTWVPLVGYALRQDASPTSATPASSEPLVYCLELIDDTSAPQMTRNQAQAAGHSRVVFEVWNAAAGH